MTKRERNGYALLAVLWICTGVAGLTFLISTFAREAVATSRNRVALTAAEWSTRSCLAHVRRVLNDAMTFEIDAWDHADRVLAAARLPGGCRMTVRAVGARLDINTAPDFMLRRLFIRLGMSAETADSAATAVVAWRAHRPFVDVRETQRVPALERVSGLDSVLDVEPTGSAIVVNQAPAAVLALLPGFTDRTIAEVLDARRRQRPVASFLELSAWLSPDVPEASAQLPGLVLLTPSAWIVTVRARAGRLPMTAVTEAVLARGGQRTLISRRREWTE